MVHELRIRNFLSFKEETIISFEASKDVFQQDSMLVTMNDGTRLSRLAIVYGANASGKSNLLAAFEYLFWFWKRKTGDDELLTGVEPFALDDDTPSRPSEFELKIYVNDKKYVYQLSLTPKNILSEKLLVYNSNQPSQLMHRELVDGNTVLKFNAALIKVSAAVKEQLTAKCLNNTSFFAARKSVNCNLGEIDDVRDWMINHTLPVIDLGQNMFTYAESKMLDNPDAKRHLLEFSQLIGLNIEDMIVEKDYMSLTPEMIQFMQASGRLSEENVSKLNKDPRMQTGFKTDFRVSVNTNNGKKVYTLPKSSQSDGTLRSMGVETALYVAEQNNKLLPIDEIESSLHPMLLKFMIQRFLKTESRCQLLLTTHYDPLFNAIDDYLRKDSFWLMDKEENGNSVLHSLVSKNGVNKMRSLQRAYLNNKLGALPQIAEF
ncbi:AAA family ATPase [Bacteroides heparinolyticus]|uniref:AAA family ATPase n=1 Tax=Prevotella heparinolytica TaxID=28113 RepID=UPI00359FAC98